MNGRSGRNDLPESEVLSDLPVLDPNDFAERGLSSDLKGLSDRDVFSGRVWRPDFDDRSDLVDLSDLENFPGAFPVSSEVRRFDP